MNVNSKEYKNAQRAKNHEVSIMAGFMAKDPKGLQLERLLQKARKVLDIPLNATREQIKTAFTQMAKYHHPDNVENMMKAALNGHNPGQGYPLQSMCKAKDLLLKHLETEK